MKFEEVFSTLREDKGRYYIRCKLTLKDGTERFITYYPPLQQDPKDTLYYAATERKDGIPIDTDEGWIDEIPIREILFGEWEIIGEEREFEIEIVRKGYGFNTVIVRAYTEEEAIEKALDKAGNHLYSEKASHYEINYCMEID